ncbi:hypothetical protein [Croceimicrobium hydrocarbonivorans]|uniref:Response regulatory domain-containing protein n=1 Tax=Croceimicrobium hydrocarbonivorans TaxID=2761580 RepID=A0A7H0VD52_9FLAO|nr:hypothetical protein [Croceimicrobium hydrocarbonivorans]QNR23650.1 hypothetical protein H4K34_14900 [Croceimicrobium hydrocarbonivorans]
MEILKILIAEDDDSELQTYKDAIKTFNQEYNGTYSIEAIMCRTEEDGRENLAKFQNDFCGAIIDLNLSGIAAGKREGNNLIMTIYDSLRFPVFVVTGTPGDIDKNLPSDNLFLKVITRGEKDFIEIYREILSIYETGVTKILGKRGQVEKRLDEIFWKHLSNSFDFLLNSGKDSNYKEQILLRYTLAHLQEYLDLDENSGGFLYYEATEFLLTPVIKKTPYTGEIVRDKSTEEYFVILTPACDMAQEKARSILLAKIELKSEEGTLRDFISLAKKEPKSYEDAKKVDAAKDRLQEVIRNRWPKYHLVPGSNLMETGLINFQKLKSIKVKELRGGFDRIAQINGAFVKDIIARFSYYYSRQGAPDLDQEVILRNILN